MSYCNNLLDPNQRKAKRTVERILSLVSSALVLALATQPAAAQFEDYLTQRWFAIEVIVFERSNIDDKNTLEALAHPRVAAESDALDLNPGETLIQLTETVMPTDVNEALADEDTQLSVREPTEQRKLLESLALEEGPIAALEEDPTAQMLALDFLQALNAYELELEAQNLVFQADASPKLENEVQRLSRARNYKVVWRGHWLQAVPDRNEPDPLVVAVNELDNGEFQLSGSLEITVSRYLHLHAQLWYHDPAFGAELMAEELPGFRNPPAQAPNRLFTEVLPRPPVQPGRYSNPSNAQGLASSSAERSTMEQSMTMQGVPEPLFMLLDETRRMRSGILHYLDHPKLGLLVRIDKLTPPEELLAQYKLFEASQK